MNRRKYHESIKDAAQYLKALDGLEEGKGLESYPYIANKDITEFFPIRRDTDLCYCSIERGRVVFFFQGSGSIFSEDIKDWFNNFNAKKVDSEEFSEKDGIHKGLYKTWKKFEKEILQICSDHGDTKDIYVYGHSRGGGLAILASAMIAQKYYFTIHTIVMGSMRVGNAAFRDVFRKLPIHCTEIQIKRDPVPRLPFKRTMKYKNVGHIKFLKNKWWYYLPIPGVGFRVHVDYYDNILKK